MRLSFGYASALLGAAAVALAVPAAASASKPSSQVYKVPNKIRSDCSAVVDAALSQWLATVPDDSTVQFAQNGCYGQSGTITVSKRNGLKIDGRGSEFRALTPGDSHRANWRFVGGSSLSVANIAVRGSNPSGSYDPAVEWQHGISIDGVQGMTLSNVQVRETWGDGIDIYHDAASPACGDDASSARDVVIAGTTLERIGRQGVAVVDGERVTLQDSAIGPVAWWGVDLETDDACALARHVTIARNTFGATGRGVLGDYSPGGDPQVGDVLVSDNVQTAPAGGAAPSDCYSPVSSIPPAGVYHAGYQFTGNRFLARRYAFNLTRMRNGRISGNSVVFDTAFGCSPIVGANLIDTHGATINGNAFSGASSVYAADPQTTDVSASSNTT